MAQLVKRELNYLGSEDLAQYFIQSYKITDNNSKPLASAGGRKGVQVEFVLSRRLFSHILTTFLPTAAICIVAFSTNYFQVQITIFIIHLKTPATAIFSLPTSLP